MVRLSLWQIGQLVSYVKTLFNLNIIRHIKVHYSIRPTFQNLQQTHMSSTKHACGGTCRLDSPSLLYPCSVSNVHRETIAVAAARSSCVQSSCIHQHFIGLILMTRKSNQFVNHAHTNYSENTHTHKLQRKHTYTQSAANSHVLDKTRLRRHMLIWFPITYCTHIPYKTSSEQQLQQQQTTAWTAWRWLLDTK
jgi:hypothetical protein